MSDSKQTPIEDLCRQALEHYEELSQKYCHWNSLIPKAIKAYERAEKLRLADSSVNASPVGLASKIRAKSFRVTHGTYNFSVNESVVPLDWLLSELSEAAASLLDNCCDDCIAQDDCEEQKPYTQRNCIRSRLEIIFGGLVSDAEKED